MESLKSSLYLPIIHGTSQPGLAHFKGSTACGNSMGWCWSSPSAKMFHPPILILLVWETTVNTEVLDGECELGSKLCSSRDLVLCCCRTWSLAGWFLSSSKDARNIVDTQVSERTKRSSVTGASLLLIIHHVSQT